MWSGTLQAIYIAREESGRPAAVERVQAVAGKGLEGDRYFGGALWKPPFEEREVTLIEIETIEALAREGIELAPGDARRQLITRGVPLNHLVGAEFTVGEVLIKGWRLCEPCGHLGKLTSPAVTKALVHRGGLRGQIVRGGVVSVGDRIALTSPSAATNR